MKKNKIRLLLVEDDPNLGSLLNDYLSAKEFEVTLATDGEEGFKTFAQHTFDFVVLDIMLPEKDGFTVAKEIRQINQKVPILFLTAKSLKEDRLEGFDVGGDDYVTKPFSMEELLRRIHAILRRTDNTWLDEADKTEFEIGNFKFDYDRQMLQHKDEDDSVKLTTKENELLHLLCLNRNSVMERRYALNAIWGDDNYFNGRSMDVYIAKLRKYLRKDPKIEIVNVHGKGFKLLVD